jgi:hypothetical protein
VADEDLERPSLLPVWATIAVVALAIVGILAIINWFIRLAFGLAKGVLLVALVIGLIALVRAVARRR